MTEFTTKTDINNRRRVTKQIGSPQMMDIGKMPPQAVDLEEAVLGAIMLEKDALLNTIDILKPQSFYKDVNARIFTAIQSLANRTEPVDILTVTQELKKTGELEIVGGAYYITQLTNRVASAANAEFHAHIVIQKFIQRELIRVSSDTIRESYEDGADVFELLDRAEKNLFSIVSGNIKQEVEHVSSITKDAISQFEQMQMQKTGAFGVPSGLTTLDRITSGWQKSDLIIIAARPAMGKTALVLTMAKNAAIEFNKSVAVFSLEMSKLQLTTRLISAEAEINGNDFKRLSEDNKFTDEQWKQVMVATNKINSAPIFIDDTAALTIFELRAKARRLKEKQEIELIIIDYLQLMSGISDNKNGNREQEISFISRSLKGLAKELNIPIIALSQLSRAVETRGGDKKPVLSDLRESGAIEQDADLVIFIHRPEYYGIFTDGQGNDTRGAGELIVAKNRNGATDTANVLFKNHITTFCDPEDWSMPSYEEKLSNLSNHKNESFTMDPDNDDDKPF